MKKINIKILILIFLFSLPVSSEEININSQSMNIEENGNIVKGNNAEATFPKKNIFVKSKKIIHDKKKKLAIFKEDVEFIDLDNNLQIFGQHVVYKFDEDLIYGIGETLIEFDNRYIIKSNDIFYNPEIKKIYSNKKTIINDDKNNIYYLHDRFKIDLKKEIIKSNKASIIDNKNNKYFFEDLIIDLKINEIIGRELKLDFENSYFGNKENDPILKGRGAISNEKELKIYKAVFSTCNTNKKKCRGWELSSDEFVHDKIKKIFEYKNSWLSLFDKKIFYFPYFNHPDPSVKRKSGFLTPSYSTSQNLGFSINTPYYKVLSSDRDITFNPRFYAERSYLLQNEYRQALEKSDIVSDFSVLLGDEGTKSHLFFNQIGKFQENLDFEINLQKVRNDNYLKTYNLKNSSSIINDESLLKTNLSTKWEIDEKTSLENSFIVYEDLSKNNNDRYQYIFPNFNFSKNVEISEKYNGSFDFRSYGFNKNYNTNVKETSITNDFLFGSNNYILNHGIIYNYDFLIKNSNSYSENSSNFDENTDYNVYEIVKFDTSYPLINQTVDFTNYLTPKFSFKYSPNGNTDMSDKNILINYDNAFSLNRIGTNYQVEGGKSLTIGLEYKGVHEKRGEIFDFKIGNILSDKKKNKMPTKSKLNQTRSDIFGNLNYKVNKNIDLGYSFSYDRDLDYSNMEGLNLNLTVNNIYTNFYYYTEDNDFGSKENISNKTKYSNNNNNFTFKSSKDLNSNFTEYYNFNYEYFTDCISLNLNYDKSFYRDGNLKPNETLSFLIKIIPFTEVGVKNLKSF